MSVEDAFLRRILAEPDDREARLVYADWLEERGDARAELIRLEAEMAELPVWSDRYAALKPRRTALREQTELRWRQSLGYVPTHRPMFGKLPEHRHERWRLFEEFLETWHRPHGEITKESLALLESQEEVNLPTALRELYLRAGRNSAPQPFSFHLLPVNEVAFFEDTDGLAFFIGSRQLSMWGSRLSDFHICDPPVYELSPEFQFACATVSEFALWSLLYETCFIRGTPEEVAFVCDDVREGFVAQAENNFGQCDFSATLNPRFFEREDLILMILREGTDDFVFGKARTRGAFEKLNEEFRKSLRETDY